MTIVDDNVGLAVLGDLGDHFFNKKKSWEIEVLCANLNLTFGFRLSHGAKLGAQGAHGSFQRWNGGNEELTSLPWPWSNSRLNCLKESWLVWRNLSGKTCLRCPLVSWKRQEQKVKKVKNKIGRNIRLAMWQANLSDVNSRMIYKEHEQRIIKTSAEASYKGAA